jgi:hypothetical protein
MPGLPDTEHSVNSFYGSHKQVGDMERVLSRFASWVTCARTSCDQVMRMPLRLMAVQGPPSSLQAIDVGLQIKGAKLPLAMVLNGKHSGTAAVSQGL